MPMNLPILDGWSVARLLKGDARTNSIPIIALISHSLSDATDKELLAGCDIYHAKPVDFARLLEQIASMTLPLDEPA